MTADSNDPLREHLEILCCPSCGRDLLATAEGFVCAECGRSFASDHGMPLLFWPTDWDESSEDLAAQVREFYEESPFPNYEEFDSVAGLIAKAREGRFAKMLDEHTPSGALVLECGCGTGQLTNFLSIASRTVFGTDMCLNSLRLAADFKRKNDLTRAAFLQMNLFRPVFKPKSLDLVICNGVLHHTPDPFRGFKSIAELVKPNGFILIGLYHRYGRLVTDLRRLIFRLTGDRLTALDPNLRTGERVGARREAWFRDQYKHPLESKHTIGEALGWLEQCDFDVVRSFPRSVPFQSFSQDENLFEPERPGNRVERMLVELGMVFSGSREGGFFTILGRRRVSA